MSALMDRPNTGETLTRVRTVAVIGSGIMGAGIAAFFADRGLTVQLYDLNQDLVRQNLRKLTDPKARIPAIMSSRSARRISPLGLDDMDAHLAEADLIVEAVPEVLKIKQSTFEHVDRVRRAGSIVASNTSGIAVKTMVEGRSDDFRQSFLVVHFFNPVRYMALVELIPTPETSPAVVEGLHALLLKAGKTPVVGKDTPNFIANRVGVYSMLKTLQLVKKYGLTIEEADMLTGPPMGAPKTGTFRLADLVGIDTLVHVAENAHTGCPEDEERSVFEPAPILAQLVEEGRFGDKTKKGFYKKTRGPKGQRVIESTDLETGAYRPQQKPRSDAVRVAKTYSRPAERVRALVTYDDQDKHCLFARELAVAVGAYALRRVGEIADDAQTIDVAMRAGFGRELAPIETLDAIGLERVRTYLKAFRLGVPQAIEDAIAAGEPLVRRPSPRPGTISLPWLVKLGKVVRENLSARLLDLGDGVLCCELTSKMVPAMNPVDDYIVSMIEQAHEEIEAGRFRALVIGNQAPHFSAGANLMMVLELAKAKRFDAIREVSRRLQEVNLKNLHAPFPVVVCPHGMTLGGGLEIAMGGQVRILYGELYTGLVEVGVGLVPAGGGCYFLLRQLIERMAKRRPGLMPPVARAFELIGFGKVSSSAFDAVGKGLCLKTDPVCFSKPEQIQRAKEVALQRLSGFTPVPRMALPLPGEPGRLALEAQIEDMRKAGKITDHSALIARVQARILTGGSYATPVRPAQPEEILELEREGFLELCGERKTLERMGHMLKKGKPLIN